MDGLLCVTAHPDWVVLWGQVVGTHSSTSTGILNHVQAWLEKEPLLQVEETELTTLGFCPTFLAENESPFCEVPFASDAANPDSQSESFPFSPKSGAVMATIIVVAIVLVMVMTVCLLTCVVWRWKKAYSRKLRYYDLFLALVC